MNWKQGRVGGGWWSAATSRSMQGCARTYPVYTDEQSFGSRKDCGSFIVSLFSKLTRHLLKIRNVKISKCS